VQVLALANHGAEAGTAASVLGAVNFGMAGLVSPVVGLFTITDAVPMAAVMAIAVVVAIAALWLVVQPRTVPALSS
jgi:DHA1 family bicyclomycin/chloramphenicol resistance-like MFS transporter